MSTPFVSAIEPPSERSGVAWWFLFRDDRLLVSENDDTISVPLLSDLDDLGVTVSRVHYLGRLGDHDCFTAELAPDFPLPEGTALHGVRGLYARLSDELFSLAGRAVQILTWDRTHQFCGQCGTPTRLVPGERARACPHCGLTAYPRLSPAVIVLITRGDEVLLARGLRFPGNFYSTPAGFVEPGESLEQTVERELAEELSIKVRDIRYFGSQPWPYPHQLMIGFTCTWESGEIVVDPTELADARWFTRDNLPNMPPPLSIARRLINSYIHASS